jgi:hypothetical protein
MASRVVSSHSKLGQLFAELVRPIQYIYEWACFEGTDKSVCTHVSWLTECTQHKHANKAVR